jgi:hypothetical protein
MDVNVRWQDRGRRLAGTGPFLRTQSLGTRL